MRQIDGHPMRQTAKHFIGLVLTLLAVLPMQAQQENAAFYIYQNDGHFDGFFYDEVEKISYSKLDTLGREFDDYVSQEIVTADSTYRFMLSAIDSVGFVQPEIKTNPKLRNMREEGMLTYLSSKDEETMTLTFSASMPESLRPKVGDVLVDFDLDELFGGKVKSVNTSGGITVVCDHLESVHDIYEQYITVEQYGKDNEGNLVKRRVAGLPEMTVGQFQSQKVRKEAGSYEFNLFNFGLSGHYPVYSSPEGDVNISIDVDVNVAMDVKAVWDFPFFGPDYLSITTTLNNDIGLGFTLDGKVKDIYPLGLVPGGGIPVPANCPLFVITFGPDVFIGGEYHAKLNFQTPKFKGKLWGRLELAGDFKSPKFTFGSGTPPGEQEPDLAKEAASNTWSGSVEFNGFEQCGIMTNFSFGASKLLKWALNTEVTFTTYIGPKVTGALNLSISNVMQDQMSAYNLLKDSKLTFSPLGASYEAKAKLKTLFTEAREWTLADGSYNLLGDIDLYLVPEFEIGDISVTETDPRHSTITASLTPSRNLIWPAKVGIALFDSDNNMVDYRFCTSYSPNPHESVEVGDYWQYNSMWNKLKSLSVKLTPPTGGEYVLRPIIQQFGFDIVASPAEKVYVNMLHTKVNPQLLIMPSKKGTVTSEVITNHKTLSLDLGHDVHGNPLPVQGYDAKLQGHTISVSPTQDLKGFDRFNNQFFAVGETVDNGQTYTDMAKIDLLQFGDGEFNQAHVTEISDALDEDYRHLYGLSIHYINSSTTVTGKDSRVTASVDLSSKSDVYDRQEWVGRKGELDVTFHREIDSTIVGNLQRDQKFQELTVKSATISYEERTNISQSKYKDTFTYRDYETALRIGDRIAQHYRLTRKAVISHETPASYGGGQYGIVSESVGGSWTPEQVDKYEEELTVFFNDGTTETKTWNIPKSKVGISVRYVYEEQ